jgi:cytochrome c-type biogenesis protein CcmF
VKPLILWLWIGGALMAIGTVLAAFPGKRRRPTAPVSADTVMTQPDVVKHV